MIGAACLFVAGLALISFSIRDQRERDFAVASRLFAVFDAKAELSDSEAHALQELADATTGIRAAFLRVALTDAKKSARLSAHQHALSVALSKVDRRETRALYDDEVLSHIETSGDAVVLRECFALVARWGILDVLGLAERDRLAGTLVERVGGTQDTELRNELIAGLGQFKGQISTGTAQQQAGAIVALLLKEQDSYAARSLASVLPVFTSQIGEGEADELTVELVRKIQVTFSRERLAPLLAALQEIESRGSSPVKAETGQMLVERIELARDPADLPLWGPVLMPLGNTFRESKADELATRLLRRIEFETQSLSLQSLVTALNAFAPNVSSTKAEEIARVLITRVREGDIVSLPTEVAGILQLGAKLRAETFDQARHSLLDNLRKQDDAKALALVGFNLGELSVGVSKGGFDDAVKIIVDKMSRQDGSYELTLLDGALENLAKVGISPSTAAGGAKLLVERIGREQHIPEFLRLAVGLEILAKWVPEESDGLLTGHLIERMRESSSASVLRAVAFNIGDFEAGASRAQILAAATKLSQRIAIEDRTTDLRALAAGMVNLGDRVPEQFFEDAAARAEGLMKTEADFEARTDLTATLRALKERAGEEDEAQEPETETKLDEASARILCDPLSNQEEWEQLALKIVPTKTGKQGDDDDDEERADFHTLLVADDDGESDTTGQHVGYPIDFNRLSDALDPFRPHALRDSRMTPAAVTGAGLVIVSLLLAIAAMRRSRVTA